jgi:hypothetical protein
MHFQSLNLDSPKPQPQLAKGILVLIIHLHGLYGIILHGLNEQMRSWMFKTLQSSITSHYFKSLSLIFWALQSDILERQGDI